MTKKAIYTALALIPAGRVISYGELGKQAGLSNAARYVGTTLRNLPPDTSLPWHRVVNSQRKISLEKDSDGYRVQKQRLEEEGVSFLKEKIPQAFFISTVRRGETEGG